MKEEKQNMIQQDMKRKEKREKIREQKNRIEK